MRIVLPGEIVGTSDMLYGEGIYADNEYLRSEYLGILVSEGDIIRVKPLKRPPLPRIGSIVVGYVLSIIRGRIIQIQVFNVDGNFVQPFTAIAKPPDDVPSVESYARVGDFVRARIIDDKKMIATLEGEDLGVILARCGRCNYPLVMENEENAGNIAKLRCPVCGATETRKTAKDYPEIVKIALEKSLEEVMLDTYRQIPFEMR